MAGIPTSGNLPITQLQMQDAFLTSEHLILCKTLDAAMALRQNKINIGTSIYPDIDYAIYEIEVDASVESMFSKLIDAPTDQLEHLVSSNLYYAASIFDDRSKIPDIEIYRATSAEIQPKLIACCCFSSTSEPVELKSKPERCFLL